MFKRTLANNLKQNWSQWLSAVVAGTVFVCGLCWQNVGLLGGGAAALCLVFRQIGASSYTQEPFRARGDRTATRSSGEGDTTSSSAPPILNQLQSSLSPPSTDALVDELI